ncbi:MAG: flagellar biosynthesis protein FlhB [Lachnospiraceae bacterium]|nr:flagellar biosynthesis protein FlhB [Lachnospiraceae bacterium]
MELTETLYMPLDLQFFAKDGPGGEKTEEPTSKRLTDARKDGKVAKSKEVATSLTLFSLFIVLKVYVGNMGNLLSENFHMAYGKIPDLVTFTGGNMEIGVFSTLVKEMMKRVLLIILPFLAVAFVVNFVADLVQVKWKPTRKPLKPKFNKLNPVNGMKKLFSIHSVIELLKSIAKIGVMALVIYNSLKNELVTLFSLYDISVWATVYYAGNLLIGIGLKIAAIFLIIAALDYAFQKWKFHQDMKMTKQEVKDEYKNTEGDPQIKGKIRSKMMEASRRRMMQEVPKADVVITNPTHFAVAISYERSREGSAPVVIAKGADYLAQRIKEIARENQVEIVENKPLARSLYADVEVGEEIPPELYLAVAEVLAAVYKKKGLV